ncbi:MAG: hypothetical protein GY745_10425 [Actinomycetia bacterium]|nr:hypothetical protein [Actinomycetes bacterium]
MATTPAYAACGSGGPIVIDDFSLNQSANSTVMFPPTVLFSQRQLIGPSTVVDGGKAKLVAPNLLDASELRYEVNLDLVGCTEIVLQNVTEFGRTPKLTLHSMASSDIVFGTTTSTEIIFDLGGSPPSILGSLTSIWVDPISNFVAASLIAEALIAR